MTPETVHITWLLVLCIISLGLAVVLAYRSNRWAVALAYVTLLTGHLSGYCQVRTSALWFWGVASLIVLGLYYLLPEQVGKARVGVSHFSTGAVVGAVLGMLTNTMTGIIIGCVIGVLISAVAFSRLDAGRQLGFPSRKAMNYLLAKGMPLVIIFSMLSIIAIQLINGGI